MLHTKNIKNVAEVAEQSGKGVRLYYSIADNSVSTKTTSWSGKGEYYVCEFLRKNTAEEITETINRWLSM